MESFELSKHKCEGSNRMVDISLLCEYRSRGNTVLCVESCGNTEEVIRKIYQKSQYLPLM